MSHRVAAATGAALILAIVGCTSPGSSLAPSGSPAPATPSPATVGPPATTQPTQSTSPIGPFGEPFDILPAEPPPGFVPPITCSGEIGTADPVAIVQLKGTTEDELGDFVLRDYADPANVRTVCTFLARPNAYEHSSRFIDGRHFVMEASTEGDRKLFVIIDVPGGRLRWFELPETPGWGSQLITVAPGLDRIVWKSVDPEGKAIDEIHVTTAAGDQVIASLPDRNMGRCGSDEDSNEGGYAASGSHLYVLNQPYALNNSLVVLEGAETRLSILAPDEDWADGKWPAMALWSPTSPTLYFRQDGDVWTWTPSAGRKRFMNDVTWYHPTISPDGRYLAYHVKVGDGTETYLVDLSGDRKPVRIGSGAYPVFLGATQLWYLRDGLSGGCEGFSEPKEVIYDASDGSEVQSDIHVVLAAWPSTNSNK